MKKNSFAHTGCKPPPLGGHESCEWGLFYLLGSVSFDSEDLKRLRALSPLGQKHAFWIWIGNLPIVQRNVLTTEPRPQIWHIRVWIIAIIKSNCKKEFTTRKTCWIAVLLLANSGAESHSEDWTWQLSIRSEVSFQSIIGQWNTRDFDIVAAL